GSCHGVVVEKGYDVASRNLDPAVARAGQAARPSIFHADDVRELGRDTTQQQWVVVDDDDDVERSSCLGRDALDGIEELVPATSGIGADHDRDRRGRDGARLTGFRSRPDLRRPARHQSSSGGASHAVVRLAPGSIRSLISSTADRKRAAASLRLWRPSLFKMFWT